MLEILLLIKASLVSHSLYLFIVKLLTIFCVITLDIEHNDQFSKRRTHHVRHSTNKVAALKKNDNGSNYHGKSLDSKPGLFFKQLGSTSNCNEPSTNNLFQRYFIKFFLSNFLI